MDEHEYYAEGVVERRETAPDWEDALEQAGYTAFDNMDSPDMADLLNMIYKIRVDRKEDVATRAFDIFDLLDKQIEREARKILNI